ncbi:MAG: hypothetical protein JNL26_10180 [Gemmatimonadetes bacterium]|nr:hypothetical protein [Gemmatimonadota bacterium]
MRRGLFVSLILIATAAAHASAQQSDTASLGATATWSADQHRGASDPIEVTLSRALRHGESLALLVGTTDVTAFVDVQGTHVRYRPRASDWAGRESAVVVYLVRDTSWTEVASLPIKVRNRFGLDDGQVLPAADLASAGQLKEGGTSAPQSPRMTYQDLTLRLGLSSSLRRGPWQAEWAANALGTSRKEQRLQFGEKGEDALPVDLTDYQVRVSRGGMALAAGTVRRTDHRHLLGTFSSRGVGGNVKLGSAGELDAAVMNGTNVVGLGNFLGLAESAHRISAGRLGLELLPQRPGAMHVTVSGVHGSVLPRQNVNQASVTDAERSTGWGVQLDAAVPDDRVAFAGGVAQSRFTNPVDPLLAGDSTLVPVREERRMARFGELRVQLIREWRVTDSLAASLSLNARHERVDPLYRSIGSSPQADAENNGLDLTAGLGALALTGQFGRSRDNLADIGTILTSRTHTGALTAALPLVAVVGSPEDWFLPVLSYGRQSTHQFGDGIPDGGMYSASDLPDQASVSQTAAAEWSRANTTFSYRWNQSVQDNRQPGMETSDITGTVHTVALGLAPRAGLTVGLDASRERQVLADSDLRQGLDRVGVVTRWQLNALTDLSGNVSRARTQPSGGEGARTNVEMQFEGSRAFSFYKMRDGSPQSRVFLRFARALQSQDPRTNGVIRDRSVRWSLNAGGSVRFF